MTTLTLTGALRFRNAREHRALAHLWGWCNELRNALCEQRLSVQPLELTSNSELQPFGTPAEGSGLTVPTHPKALQ